jgi:hypothetical protein
MEHTQDFKDEAIATLELIPRAQRKHRAPDIDGFNQMLLSIRSSFKRRQQYIASP